MGAEGGGGVLMSACEQKYRSNKSMPLSVSSKERIYFRP